MKRAFLFASGAGLGAAYMYLFDPDLGRRRRGLLSDQIVSKTHRLQDGLEKCVRDTAQRSQGFLFELRRRFGADNVPDEVLVERVRSKLGRYASHPSAIHVSAHDGRVELSGPILSHEVQRLFDAVRAIPGVRSVDNQLDAHAEAGRLSALQGGRPAPGEHWNINEANWAPATRLLAAATGGLLVAYGATQRFPVACAVGTAGLGLLAVAGIGGVSQPARREGRRRRMPQPVREPATSMQTSRGHI